MIIKRHNEKEILEWITFANVIIGVGKFLRQSGGPT